MSTNILLLEYGSELLEEILWSDIYSRFRRSENLHIFKGEGCNFCTIRGSKWSMIGWRGAICLGDQ